jgi:hypothetical protein
MENCTHTEFHQRLSDGFAAWQAILEYENS